MREHPIPFSTEMVRAILDGRKTMTRRVIKPQPERQGNLWIWERTAWDDYMGHISDLSPLDKCPFGQIGDRLWVRERIRNCMEYVAYPSDGYIDKSADWVWKNNILPSFCMPKCLARIWLEITNIRVERLQDITDDDCFSEGVDETDFYHNAEHYSLGGSPLQGGSVEKCAFIGLWDSIYGKTYPYESNPWVWGIEFKKLESVK